MSSTSRVVQADVYETLRTHQRRIDQLARSDGSERWILVGDVSDPESPPFENGWGNVGDPYQAVAFKRFLNHVELRGAFTGGADGTVIFTLAPPYRPIKREVLSAGNLADGSGTFTVYIDPDGSVTYLSACACGGGGGGGSITEITSGDGSLSVTFPTGPIVDLKVIGGPGVWKRYGIDSSNANPFTNVTIGDGILVARWWTPGPVVAAYDTPPFMVYIYVALKFGSTTAVTGDIVFQEPFDIDGQPLEIDPFLQQGSMGTPDPFMLAWPTQAQALQGSDGSGRQYPGFGVTPTDSTRFVSNNVDPHGGAVWGPTEPFTWAEGDFLGVQRTYLGAFYGD